MYTNWAKKFNNNNNNNNDTSMPETLQEFFDIVDKWGVLGAMAEGSLEIERIDKQFDDMIAQVDLKYGQKNLRATVTEKQIERIVITHEHWILKQYIERIQDYNVSNAENLSINKRNRNIDRNRNRNRNNTQASVLDQVEEESKIGQNDNDGDEYSKISNEDLKEMEAVRNEMFDVFSQLDPTFAAIRKEVTSPEYVAGNTRTNELLYDFTHDQASATTSINPGIVAIRDGNVSSNHSNNSNRRPKPNHKATATNTVTITAVEPSEEFKVESNGDDRAVRDEREPKRSGSGTTGTSRSSVQQQVEPTRRGSGSGSPSRVRGDDMDSRSNENKNKGEGMTGYQDGEMSIEEFQKLHNSLSIQCSRYELNDIADEFDDIIEESLSQLSMSVKRIRARALSSVSKDEQVNTNMSQSRKNTQASDIDVIVNMEEIKISVKKIYEQMRQCSDEATKKEHLRRQIKRFIKKYASPKPIN